VSQPSEDGGGKVLRNVVIVPHHYTPVLMNHFNLFYADLLSCNF